MIPFTLLQKPSENFLRKCEMWQVCNKVDTYATPWIERQCRCGNNKACSTSLSEYDGHTIADRTRQFKVSQIESHFFFVLIYQ